MKGTLSILAILTASCVTMLGQGRVAFNNQSTFNTQDAITIHSFWTMGSAGGSPGWGIGSDKYSVQLLWVPGTGFTESSFYAANPSASAAFSGFAFLAPTGPLATFSGFFDGGVVNLGGPPGLYTMQVRAWYNVGSGNATYAGAYANNVNAGRSQLFTMDVTASPTAINSTVFPGFQVYFPPLPEPSTFALAGLGTVGMLLFRRKQ